MLGGRIEVEAVIAAPLREVWATWTNLESLPEWMPAVVSVRRVGEQTEGVGAEIEFTARNAWRTVTYRMRITHWDEAKLVRQEIVPGSGKGLWAGLLDQQSTEWTFAPENGNTRIAATQNMKLKGLADILSQPWLLIFDRQLYRRAFRRLAELVAGEAP